MRSSDNERTTDTHAQAYTHEFVVSLSIDFVVNLFLEAFSSDSIVMYLSDVVPQQFKEAYFWL